MNADQLRAAVNLNRIGMYERTMLFEWLLFGFVILGVKLNGTPLVAVLGERWSSARQVLRDIGIAIAFLIGSIFITSILGGHAHGGGPDPAIQFLLPHGKAEIAVWMALSLTAGICEETLFRGYLQRQFTALSKNAAVGILLSAAMFGGAHSYQGFAKAMSIAVLGAMYGTLAYWRRSVRPGMIGHTLEDIIGGLFAGSIHH
jgi:membrane protease YdiL (CAAX protease family)